MDDTSDNPEPPRTFNRLRPNGNAQDGSTNAAEFKIHVGKDYQAVCPDLVPEQERNLQQIGDKALLVWSPTENIADDIIDDFIGLSLRKYGYNREQALGMLFWHKYNMAHAVYDLSNFTPFAEPWSEDEKTLFEQGIQLHGKDFFKISKMFDDKSVASLVSYYYSWKKPKWKTVATENQQPEQSENV